MQADTFMRKSLRVITLFLGIITLAGCAFPGVYKINVQQGTIVKQSDLDALKPGMTPKQVHFVLGSPSLINTFDHTKEGYLYTFQKAGGKIQTQRVTVFYDAQRKFSHYEAALLEDTPAY